MVLLAAGYVATTALPAIGPTVNGLTAGIVGILLATIYRLGKPNIKEPLTWGIALVAFVVAFLGISAALIVVAAGLLGTLLLSPPSAAQDQQRKEGRP
jgi:chromate transport protein ChrA